MRYKATSLAILIAAILHTPTTTANEQPVAEEDKNADIEKIEVIGHKLSALNQDVSGSISVLSSQEIQRNQEAELSNLLKELPNVDMAGSAAPLSGMPVIRGLSGERIHIAVDNVKRKNESDGDTRITQINSLGVDPQQLKQVQVLRGADSLTVGSGALGGSIRLVTKDARDYLGGENGIGGKVTASHQSASDAKIIGASGFYLSDMLDTVLHISKTKFADVDIVGKSEADYTDPTQVEAVALLDEIKNKSERTNLTLKNTWFIDDIQQLKAKVDWNETISADQPYRQRADLAIRYPTLLEDYKNDYTELMLNYSFFGNSDLIDLDIQAIYSDKGYDKITKGYITRGTNKIPFDSDKNGKTKRKSLRVANLSEFSGVVNHKLALELNWEHEDFEQTEVSSNKTEQFYGYSKASNLSFSIIDQASFFSEQLLATAGLRYDTYKRSNNIFSNYANNDDGELSNELGLTYKATENVNLYLKYAEAFRAPTVQELYKKDEWRCHIGGKICYQEPQPNLKPETSKNLEGGIGLSWQDTTWADAFSLKLMFFDNEIKDYIANVPFMYYIDANGEKKLGSPGPEPVNGVPVATHRDYSAKNIGKLYSKGMELEVNYSLKNWNAYLGYSSLDMDVEGVPNFFLGKIEHDKRPYTEAPADKLTVNLNYQLLSSLNIGGQLLHYREQKRLPELYLNFGYGTQTYTVYNLNATYQAQGALEGLSVIAGIDNVTNKRYLRAPASEANDPAEVGRNYKITLSYQF